LISSTIILAVLRSGSPKNEAGPDTEKSAPILIGGAANTDPAVKDRNNIERTIQKNFFDINPSFFRKLLLDQLPGNKLHVHAVHYKQKATVSIYPWLFCNLF